jgi:zinc ribbon protein
VEEQEKATPDAIIRRLEAFRRQYGQGSITLAGYREILGQFRFKDDNGRLWAPGANSSKWYMWEKGNWNAYTPPGLLTLPTDDERLDTFKARQSRNPVASGLLFCANCGKQLTEGARFCSTCGASYQFSKGATTPTYAPSPLKLAAPTRPAGVTGIAVLQIIGSLIVISLGFAIFAPLLALGVLSLVLTLALFSGRNWARILMLIGAVLNIISIVGIIWGAIVLWYFTRPHVVAYFKAPK